jgi:ring-1,2-phenylacetyl-CoA epoxidase subunit PaaC
LCEALQASTDPRLREIAALASRELRYHVRYSATWLVRLGDGTAESHERAQRALHVLWRFTGELFEDDAVEQALNASGGVPLNASLRERWVASVSAVLREATLAVPTGFDGRLGGRRGVHTEHLSYLLAEMQSLARAHPGAVW